MNQIRPLRLMAMTILIFALITTGCSDQTMTPIPSNGVILAFGDSLTYGVGVDEEDSYPSELARLTKRSVINAGVSGEVTEEGLARLPAELSSTRPHTLILIEGGNDILRNHDLTKTKSNLRKMIQLAHNKGVQVLLVTMPAKHIFSSEAKLYSELAEEFGLAYEDSIIASLLKSPEMKSDPIHFNEAGYAKLAQRIHTLLIEHGAL